MKESVVHIIYELKSPFEAKVWHMYCGVTTAWDDDSIGHVFRSESDAHKADCAACKTAFLAEKAR